MIWDHWVSNPLLVQLGFVLVHFLWQGAIIALSLAVGLWLMRHRAANRRYLLCLLAMLLLTACPVGTLLYVRAHPISIPVVEEPLIMVVHEPSILPPETKLITGADDIDLMTTDHAVPPDKNVSIVNDEALNSTAEIAEIPPAASDEAIVESPVAALAPTLSETPVESPTASGRDPAGLLLIQGLSLGAVIWAIGVVVLALRLMIGLLALHRLRRNERAALPETVLPLVHGLLERMGLVGRVAVYAGHSISEPLAFGLLRPVVLLPISVLTQCPVELLEAMIAHELAHIHRYDLWVNLFQRVAETLLFYHPAVWWISGRMRMERELCCDDLAVTVTGRRAEYAEALVELARISRIGPAAAWSAGLFGSRMTILSRVSRVLQLPQPPQQSRYWLAGPLSLLLAGSLILAAQIQAANPQPPVAAKESSSRQPENSETKTITSDNPTAETKPASVKDELLKEILDSPELVILKEKPPQTSFIGTDVFNEMTERAEQLKKDLLEQWQALEPAVGIIQDFYSFRDALYEGNEAALGKHFAPQGRSASPEDIRRLLADIKTLGLDEYRTSPSVPWIIERIAFPDNHQMALLSCMRFERTYLEQTVRVRIWCWMASSDNRWKVYRLAVVPDAGNVASFFGLFPVSREGNDKAERLVLDFHKHLGAQLPADTMLTMHSIRFDGGYATNCYTYFCQYNADTKDVINLSSPHRGRSGLSAQNYDFLVPIRRARLFVVPTEVDQRSGLPSPPPPRRARRTPVPIVSETVAKPPPVKTTRIPVRSLVDGVVTEVKVTDGQKVKKGDLLIQLDDKEAELGLMKARNMFETAKADYEVAKSNMHTQGAESNLRNARLNLELANIEVETWQFRLERTRITSPADGTVELNKSVYLSGKKIQAGEDLLWLIVTEPAPEPVSGSDESPQPVESGDSSRERGGESREAYSGPGMVGARAPSSHAASMDNLKNIVVACMFYAEKNRGQFPPDLETLVKESHISPQLLIAPQDQSGATCSYIYVSGQKNGIDPRNVLFYENPDINQGEGVNVAFLDGHVQWMSIGDFEKALEETRGRLKQENSRARRR